MKSNMCTPLTGSVYTSGDVNFAAVVVAGATFPFLLLQLLSPFLLHSF